MTQLREEDEAKVVEAAAAAIREYERQGSSHRGRHAFEGAADEILQEALDADADVWAWARLARKALRRAHPDERGPSQPTSDDGRALRAPWRPERA